MDIAERIETLRDCGFSTDADRDDLYEITRIFRENYSITIDEDNAGVMITHMAAAFRRNRTGEKVEPLDRSVFGQAEESVHFTRACGIMEDIKDGISNEVSDVEREFFLLHICMLLENLQAG